MAIVVKVPSETFKGIRGEVQFVNGVGRFEDEAKGRELANSLGYEIVEAKKAEKVEAPSAEVVEDEKPKRTTRKKATEQGE